jgi:hypothetical protein
MDTLLDELVLQILAFLPTFEDRWAASLVNWQWRRAYRVLLKPYNDARASEHLRLSLESGNRNVSCGPAVRVSGPGNEPTAMTLHMYLRGTCVQAAFCLKVNVPGIEVQWPYWYQKIAFSLSTGQSEDAWCGPGGPFVGVPDKYDGDMFDLVPLCNAGYELYQHPYDPQFARRLWQFPAIAAIRKRLFKPPCASRLFDFETATMNWNKS